MLRNKKTFSSSPCFKPGNGRLLGTPPVARMSFVYGKVLPDLVCTVLLGKSIDVALSWIVLMFADL